MNCACEDQDGVVPEHKECGYHAGVRRAIEKAARQAAEARRTYRTPMYAGLIQVIETMAVRGTGTEADPVRHVRQYWAANDSVTQFLAEFDPHHDTDPTDPSPDAAD